MSLRMHLEEDPVSFFPILWSFLIRSHLLQLLRVTDTLQRWHCCMACREYLLQKWCLHCVLWIERLGMCLITGQPRALAGVSHVSFPVKAVGQIKLSLNKLGIWREAWEHCGLGVATSRARGLSCEHWLPLGSKFGRAAAVCLGLSSALDWILAAGKDFQSSGPLECKDSNRTWYSRVLWSDCTRKGVRGWKKGHDFSCAAANPNPFAP